MSERVARIGSSFGSGDFSERNLSSRHFVMGEEESYGRVMQLPGEEDPSRPLDPPYLVFLSWRRHRGP